VLRDQRCVIAMVNDVTERRRTEQALQESQEQLRQAQKLEAIGRLAGGVAHDFNNLLTVILGYCGVIQGRLAKTDPTFAELEEIRRSGERAAALTQQLLAFGRKQVLAPRVLDLNAVVADLDQLLKRLVGENIRLVTRLDRSLGPVMVDKAQVEQVIVNLAINARDAMPTGGTLTIETANVDSSQDGPVTPDRPIGPFVRLRVQDTGTGMDAETQRRIFEPFFTTKAPGKGTGLGLATIYGIVSQSQGHIEIDSAVGRGSVFSVYLPRMAAAAAAEPRAAPTPVRSVHGSETILVVEDEELVRNLVRDMLRMQGYQVLVAADAEEALALAEKRQGPIDLVITDVVLPGISGLELIERMAYLHPESRTIAMSGYASEVIARHGALTPGVTFVQKPFQLHELTRRIREVLDTPPAHDTRERPRRGERAV
jgi:two-component system cell cycle sensor histidine kinase/response regulator CckA